MKSRTPLFAAILAVLCLIATGCDTIGKRTVSYRVQVWNEGSTQCGSIELADSASGLRVGPLRYCLPVGEIVAGDTVTYTAEAVVVDDDTTGIDIDTTAR